MMLGTVAGSAVKLDLVGDRLAVGEGVETCMAARQLGLRPVWALGTAGGIEKLPLIDGVDELTILGENDNGANRNATAAPIATRRKSAGKTGNNAACF